MTLTAEKKSTRIEVLNRNGKTVAMGVLDHKGRVVSHMFAQRVSDKERAEWFQFVSATRIGGEVETNLVVRPIEG
jgi:hypothetical protein